MSRRSECAATTTQSSSSSARRSSTPSLVETFCTRLIVSGVSTCRHSDGTVLSIDGVSGATSAWGRKLGA
jgi:hypothetical protein